MKADSRRKLMFWSAELLILACLVFVCTQLKVVFRPLVIFISVVFVPLIISLFLFYMVNPLFKLLLKVHIGKHRMPRTGAGLIIIFGLIFLIVAVIAALIPPMIHETTQFIKWLPEATREAQHWFNEYSKYQWVKSLHLEHYTDKFEAQAGKMATALLNGLTTGAGSVISTATSVVVVALTVPLMLYYMLKDGPKLVPTIQKMFVQKNHADEAADLLHRMSNALSAYISGQAISCLFVAVMTAIAYFIIHEPMALILAIIAGLANMIPYVGPYIGITPALLVSLALAPKTIIWVIVAVCIIQQIDGSLVYPKVVGKSLNIHPLTIIILLLAAGNIAGVAGMILCVPFYAVVKTVVTYFWSIHQLNHQKEAAKEEAEEN